MAELITIPHEKSSLRFEMPGPTARFADRDHFFWTEEMVETYLLTRRVMYQGRVWERHGLCNQCGQCCRWKAPLRSKDWAASFPRLEAEVEKGIWPGMLSLFLPDGEGRYWCQFLRTRYFLFGRTFICTIWRDKGFFGLPDVCAMEPCTPRLDQCPTWAEEYPECSLSFQDVTDLYLID